MRTDLSPLLGGPDFCSDLSTSAGVVASYRHTLAEIAMNPAEWAAYFGRAHPGQEYTRCLKIQRDRLLQRIERAEYRAESCRDWRPADSTAEFYPGE